MARNSQIGDIINYIPATLSESPSRWYIQYYVKHPATGEFVRKQVRVGRFKKKSDRRNWARKLISEINIKLSSGWNPFIEDETPRAYTKLLDAWNVFLKDKRNLRPDTLKVYHSEVKFMKEYVAEHSSEDLYASLFDSKLAISYMEHVWTSRNIEAVRYNNILAFSKLLFNWMIKRGYTKHNPFINIDKKKTGSKKRIMDIAPKDRKKIREYLSKKNKPFHVAVMFAFNSLLRPKEISYIKIGDIDLKRQVVIVRGSVAKNHQTRYASIPDVMIDSVKQLINSVHIPRKEWYLFSKNFRPGPYRRDPREIARYWSDLRQTLRLKKELQFYSLRDAGIIQMLRDGRSPKEVMEAADHSSIEVTNKYVKVARKESNINIKEKSTAF